VTERPLVFSDAGALLGIVSEPAGGVRPQLPLVILLNAGLIHRVGPNRLHVLVARRLAEKGIAAFRVDLSGRGDSDVRRDDLSFMASGVAEVRAAMDRLQQMYGTTRFVLMGICSGADTAGTVGCLDPRVVGLVVIEGAAYPTRRSIRRYYARRIFRGETLLNTIRGRNAIGKWLRGGARTKPAAADGGQMITTAPAASGGLQQVAAALQMLVDRGVEIMSVFTGSSAVYNYTGQIREAFPTVRFGERLREEYYPRADHTFTRLAEQSRLIDAVVGWMDEKFASVTAADAPASAWDGSGEFTEVVHF
jgi:pimeloyl-ACP methyl ester carboxylesterase